MIAGFADGGHFVSIDQDSATTQREVDPPHFHLIPCVLCFNKIIINALN